MREISRPLKSVLLISTEYLWLCTWNHLIIQISLIKIAWLFKLLWPQSSDHWSFFDWNRLDIQASSITITRSFKLLSFKPPGYSSLFNRNHPSSHVFFFFKLMFLIMIPLLKTPLHLWSLWPIGWRDGTPLDCSTLVKANVCPGTQVWLMLDSRVSRITFIALYSSFYTRYFQILCGKWTKFSKTTNFITV